MYMYYDYVMLLFALRDLWKEWGDSNFQTFSQNCQFHHRPLDSLEHFNVLLYIILSTTVSFLEDTIIYIIMFQFSSFSILCAFLFFRKYTLHVCYVFNVI